MSANHKHTHYSAADIQRYLKGELPAREMHALEAAALEDPFLADALEGMEKDRSLRGEAVLREDLSALQKRLEKRIAKKDGVVVLPFYRSAWKVAAVLLLLAGSGAVAYRYLLRGPIRQSPLASAEKKTSGANEPAGIRAMTDTMEKNDSLKTISPAPGAKDANAPAPKAAPETKATAATTAPVVSKTVASEMFVRAQREISKRENTQKETEQRKAGQKEASPAKGADSAAGVLAQAQAPAPAKDEDLSKRVAQNYKKFNAENTNDSGAAPFRGNKFEANAAASSAIRMNKYLLAGKVVDNNNNRIPLVTISFQGHHQAIRTDSTGLFRVQMLGSDSASHIRISSTGYNPVELPVGYLANNTLNDTIRLMPSRNNAFSDVAVIGYGTQKKKFVTENDKEAAGTPIEKDVPTLRSMQVKKAPDDQAAPVNGWMPFQTYLEKNKWNPTIDSTIKGIEAVSFSVNKKGRLSSFAVNRSLSPAHDSLLLRLIRQGPAWRPVNGKSGSTTVLLLYK